MTKSGRNNDVYKNTDKGNEKKPKRQRQMLTDGDSERVRKGESHPTDSADVEDGEDNHAFVVHPGNTKYASGNNRHKTTAGQQPAKIQNKSSKSFGATEHTLVKQKYATNEPIKR